MREFLIKHLQFHARFTVFGVTVKFLRAARILFPLFVFTGLVVTGDPMTWDFFWYDYILLGILAVACWLSFSFMPFSYWKYYPIQPEELEDEQLFDYMTMIDLKILKHPVTGKYSSLNKADRFLLSELRKDLERKYRMTKFNHLYNLLPAVVSIAAIVAWGIYWGS